MWIKRYRIVQYLTVLLLLAGTFLPTVTVIAQEAFNETLAVESSVSELDKNTPSSQEITKNSKEKWVESTQESTSQESSSDENASTKEQNNKLRRNQASGSVTITTENHSLDYVYTTQTRTGSVQIDGANLKGVLTNAFAEIRLPSAYIEAASFTATQSGIAQTSGTVTQDGSDYILKVPLTEMNATTTASFFFNFKFKDRVTPNGYQVTPSIAIRQENNQLISTIDRSLIYTVNTDAISLLKYVKSNTDFSYSRDNQQLYGGQDVTFFFNLSSFYEGGGNQQSWGEGKARTRMLETIHLVDSLPTYTKIDNQIATAQFDEAKNPGWTREGDTVRYTVHAESMSDAGAAEAALAKVQLNLSFPDAKDQTTVTNHVTAELIPFNQAENEMPQNVSDDISLQLTSQSVPKGVLSKNNNNGQKMNLEAGANHLVTTNWILTLTNTSTSDMKDIQVVDDQFDSRLYIKNAKIVTNSANHAFKVYGIRQDGSKEELGELNSANPQLINIDQAAIEHVNHTVSQVQAANLKESEATEAPQTYKGLAFELVSGEKLKPNERVVMWMETALRNPYDEATILTNKRFSNTATVMGKVVENQNELEFSQSSASSVTAQALPEEVRISTTTTNNNTGAVGENITYVTSLNLNKLSRGRQLRNQTVVNILPHGVKVNERNPVQYADGLKQHNLVASTEVIDNYQGIGRTAVLVHLKDLGIGDVRPNGRIMVNAVITENAIPTAIQDATNYEKNEDDFVYYTADGFNPTPANVQNLSALENKFQVSGADLTIAASLVAAKSATVVNIGFNIQSDKKIGYDKTVTHKNTLLTDYNQRFYYNLETRNYAAGNLSTFTLYDRLPYQADGRNSAFANTLDGPVEVDSQRFEVYYHTDANMPTDPNDGIDRLGWVTHVDDYHQVTAIKIVLKPGQVINQAERVHFFVPMKTPAYSDGMTDGKLATNDAHTNRDAQDAMAFGAMNSVSNQLPHYIPVEKHWVGERGIEQVVFQLFRKSQPNDILAELILNEANHWQGIFKAYADGSLLSPAITDFEVREKLAGRSSDDYYVTTVGDYRTPTGIQITNERISVALYVTKEWDDDANGGATRPTKLAVQLLRDGLPVVGQKADLTVENNWTATFDSLPKTHDGIEYQYDVVEVDAPQDYIEMKHQLTQDPDGSFNVKLVNKRVAPTAKDVNTTGIQGASQTAKPLFKAGDERAPLDKTFQPKLKDAQGNLVDKLEVAGQGSYTIASDGTVTFQPLPTFVGIAQSAIIVHQDVNGTQVEARYTPTVVAVKPIGQNTETSDIQGMTQTSQVKFQAGSVEIDGKTQTVPLVENSLQFVVDGKAVNDTTIEAKDKQGQVVGQYQLSQNGTVVFQPLPSFVGSPVVAIIKVHDQNGTTATAVYTPKVVAVRPSGKDVVSSGPQGKSQTGTPVFTAGDRRVPIVISEQQPAHFVVENEVVEATEIPAWVAGKQVGIYQLNPLTGSVVFQPNRDFVGTAEPALIQVKDANGTAASAYYTPTVWESSRQAIDKATQKIQGKKQMATPEFFYTVHQNATPEPIIISAQNPAKFIVDGQISDATTIEAHKDGKTIGTYTIEPTTGQIIFQPKLDFVGTADQAIVQVLDPNGVAVTAKYTPTVIPVIPTGQGATSRDVQGVVQKKQMIFTAGHPEVPIDAQVAATFEDGQTQQVVAGEGTYQVSFDGVVSFTPEPQFIGEAKGVVVVRVDINGTKASARYVPTVIAPAPKSPPTSSEPELPQQSSDFSHSITTSESSDVPQVSSGSDETISSNVFSSVHSSDNTIGHSDETVGKVSEQSSTQSSESSDVPQTSSEIDETRSSNVSSSIHNSDNTIGHSDETVEKVSEQSSTQTSESDEMRSSNLFSNVHSSDHSALHSDETVTQKVEKSVSNQQLPLTGEADMSWIFLGGMMLASLFELTYLIKEYRSHSRR